MKYIWNKTKLLDFLNKWVELTWLKNWVFFDAFSWTWSVWKYFKEKWFSIISNDLMYYSYVEQKAYIENNTKPNFNKLISFLKLKKTNKDNNIDLIIDYLNNIPWKKWFIYNNYTPDWTKDSWLSIRQYFTSQNWEKIDWIRLTLEDWNKKRLFDWNEYYILLSYLVNEADYLSNISWTYWAYLKIWRSVAKNKFLLKERELIYSVNNCKSYNKNTNLLIRELNNIDIAYFDIPYNQRQYSSNFHILETIARYDNPEIKWITWIRVDSWEKSSNYCKKRLVYYEVEDLIKNTNTKFFLFSYNSDWILSFEELKTIFDKYGKEIDILKKEYRRFKTDNSRKYKNEHKNLYEYLFVYKKHN